MRYSSRKLGLFPKSKRFTTLCLAVSLALMIGVALILPGAASRALSAGTATQTTGFAEPPPTDDGIVRSFGADPAPPGDYPIAPMPGLGGPLPSAVDISRTDMPVGNQGQQGSCVAWATAYYYKTMQEARGKSWNLADQQRRFSPRFMYNQINNGVDKGASFPRALQLLIDDDAVDIAECPYDQSDYLSQPTAAQHEAAKPYRDSSYAAIWRGAGGNDVNKIKAFLASGLPVPIGIPVYQGFYFCQGNWVDVPSPGETVYGNHGVCAVGYDDSAGGGQGGIKIANSWGSDWGAGGYTYLSYNFVSNYVWEAWATADREPDNPKITSLSVSQGRPGDTVTITGDNFGTNRRASWVSFNNVQAPVTSWTNASITVKVPSATSGPLTVYGWDGWGSNSISFTVLSSGPTPTWYLADGSTAWGFNTYIYIQNPNASAVTAKVTYMTTSSGAVSGPSVSLPAKSKTVINPSNTLGSADFSTKVACTDTTKSICVDRMVTWTGTGAASPEAHCSIGVTAPANTWYLAEGSSAWGFECWLLIQNPNSAQASCTLTYMFSDGTSHSVAKSVPANSRRSFFMADDIGSKDASIMVTSNRPVIPERSMYRNNKREGHCSIGTTSPSKNYYLAEGSTAWGFTTYLLIQNAGTVTNSVTTTLMTTTGTQKKISSTLAPKSRTTLKLNDALANTDFSIKVSGQNAPIIAERAAYWNNGTGEACHDSIGLGSAHTVFYLPDGQTSGGRETYTLIQNPNSSAANVEVTYMTTSGTGNKTSTYSVPAYSRLSLNMAGVYTSGSASTMVRCLTSGMRIMCERSTYWNSRGAGTNTIGGFSD